MSDVNFQKNKSLHIFPVITKTTEFGKLKIVDITSAHLLIERAQTVVESPKRLKAVLMPRGDMPSEYRI